MSSLIARQFDTIALADVILPVQFYQSMGRRGLSSEQRLMLAVLADAINIVQNSRMRHGPRAGQLCSEAQRWIFSTRDDGIFSFEHVCDALSLNASSLRRRLAAMQRESATGARIVPSRLRLKESSRTQHLTVNRVRNRRRRTARASRRR